MSRVCASSLEYVKQPAVTVALTMQPDVLVRLMDTPGFRGRGLLGRFLYAMPPSLLGRRQPEAPLFQSPFVTPITTRYCNS
jgi:hypothetical protein